MAKPSWLKANTPGGNSYSKSVSNQKPYKGKTQPGVSPKVRAIAGKVAGDISAMYEASNAIVSPSQLGKRSGKGFNTAQLWFKKHGASVSHSSGNRSTLSSPADGVSGGSGASKPAKKNPSGVTDSKRVKVTTTARAYKKSAKPRVMKGR